MKNVPVSVFPVVRSQAFPFPEGFRDGEGVDFLTGEVTFEPSVVDSSEYEPLGDLVKKLMRGGSVSVSSRVPVYEVPAGADPLEAIRNFDVTRGEGFDLSDAAVLASQLKEVAEADVVVRKKKLADDEARLKQDEEDLKEFRRIEKALAKEAGETKSSGQPPAGGAPTKSGL